MGASQLGSEFPAPVPDALMGHDHAALCQDQLDIPQAQAEHMIHAAGLMISAGKRYPG